MACGEEVEKIQMYKKRWRRRYRIVFRQALEKSNHDNDC
jgi:hypothetical protein